MVAPIVVARTEVAVPVEEVASPAVVAVVPPVVEVEADRAADKCHNTNKMGDLKRGHPFSFNFQFSTLSVCR